MGEPPKWYGVIAFVLFQVDQRGLQLDQCARRQHNAFADAVDWLGHNKN